ADVVVVWGGKWDVFGRDPLEIPGDEFFDISDAEYRRWLKNEYLSLFAHFRKFERVKLIAVVNHNEIEDERFPNLYNDFLLELRAEQEFYLLDLNEFSSRVDIRSYLPDGVHVSFGKPIDWSPTDDNSAIDLNTNWFEPALCAALEEEAPQLLSNLTCPEIDYSPRQKN
ncbi:MAG: hypothetical protein RIR69_988, partial [Actinomycetota bacterium]